MKHEIDMTPFYEPIDVTIKRWPYGGFQVNCKTRIDFKWDTACEFLECARVFGHKTKLTNDEFRKECARAVADLVEKRMFVFKANHGLLDTETTTVRFKK